MNGASVRVYSKAKNGNENVSKNFKVKEFACLDGSDTVLISPQLVTVLQKVRTHFGKPIIISSGYRTEVHNRRVDGSEYSQHKYGMAADIHIEGVSTKAIASYIEQLMPNSGGIGTYSSFVHVDVRSQKSRWNG